ncbi:hypothetical protein [Microbacterium sp. S1037]|uniref:hypothetical protein n=1 Tax=Microbacterium sp. S1037 TaxID=3398227 RepID=UPI003AAB8E48
MEPPSLDPFSIFVSFLKVLTGPSSALVWVVVGLNTIIAWVSFTRRTVRAASTSADWLARYWSYLPRFLLVVAVQAVFSVLAIMIALQWGEIQILDISLGEGPTFLGGDFELAKQSFIFWILIAFNVAILALAWTDLDESILVAGGFYAVGTLVVLIVNHNPISIAIHLLYVVATAAALFAPRLLLDV